MRFESDPDVLLDRAERAFEPAVEDVLSAARREVRSRTGFFARSLEHGEIELEGGEIRTVVGSTASSARVKERGGYMEAKRAKYLAIPQSDGSIRQVKSVRVPATPVITPAGAQFPQFMSARLRDEG